MNTVSRLTLLGALAAALVLVPATLTAQNQPGRANRQNRGNFDPAQAQQRMMERYREQLEVKNDDEWKVLETRIQKINEARREIGFAGMGRGMLARGGGRDNGNAGGGDNAGTRGGRRGAGAQRSPAAQDLQQALDSKASAEDIKAKLAKYREERKQKEANLEKAQEDLKKVLNSRQEAAAVLLGLLN